MDASERLYGWRFGTRMAMLELKKCCGQRPEEARHQLG